MDHTEPSRFYTGLVAQLYATLRSDDPDPAPYQRFIAAFGEPALELGCGDGDPMLALRLAGLDVEGLDSSADMLARCRDRAAELGLDVTVHESTIEAMALGRRYRSIYLAGATFNLLPDDATATAALDRIRDHLDPAGAALIPLFIPPDLVPGRRQEDRTEGSLMRCTVLSSERDDAARRQVNVLRYEHEQDGRSTSLERPWVLHWHTQEGFRALAVEAGLVVTAVLDATGAPSAPDADQFTFLLTLP